LGLIDPLKVVAAAAIIQYVKYWWQKQQESKKLEREKINAELQLLKAQIHPNFLFTALNNLYVYSLAASPRAPEMLLKLSDLLSYMLYECDEPLVPLEKEVEMMKDYVALEKIRLDDSIEMELSIRGDMTGKIIAPFLLLPFIENSFFQSSDQTEQSWMNIDISIESDTFTMKLAKGIMPDNTSLQSSNESLANVQKRLSLIYPQKHELKISCEREMLIVLLKIQLVYTPPTETEEDVKSLVTEQAMDQPTLYAS
jgi:LytS/YehU family sensor histidine kinase